MRLSIEEDVSAEPGHALLQAGRRGTCRRHALPAEPQGAGAAEPRLGRLAGGARAARAARRCAPRAATRSSWSGPRWSTTSPSTPGSRSRCRHWAPKPRNGGRTSHPRPAVLPAPGCAPRDRPRPSRLRLCRRCRRHRPCRPCRRTAGSGRASRTTADTRTRAGTRRAGAAGPAPTAALALVADPAGADPARCRRRRRLVVPRSRACPTGGEQRRNGTAGQNRGTAGRPEPEPEEPPTEEQPQPTGIRLRRRRRDKARCRRRHGRRNGWRWRKPAAARAAARRWSRFWTPAWRRAIRAASWRWAAATIRATRRALPAASRSIRRSPPTTTAAPPRRARRAAAAELESLCSHLNETSPEQAVLAGC